MPVWLRLAVFVASLAPLARLVWLGAHDGLTANPLEFITRSTGTWALVFLCLTLAITPLRRLSGWPQWQKLRRMLGLYCFFYALLHFAIWFWIDQQLDPRLMWDDVLRRPFIAAGFVAFALLLPLAATSPRAMMRTLGANWVRLHRLIYLIAIAAILHYWWHKAGKNDFATVRIYAAVVAALLGIRLWWAVKGALGKRSQRAAEQRSAHIV
jgi:sulfoxide reductase heme-binding subunit YedZ